MVTMIGGRLMGYLLWFMDEASGRLTARASEEMCEGRRGDYFGEDDIVRLAASVELKQLDELCV